MKLWVHTGPFDDKGLSVWAGVIGDRKLRSALFGGFGPGEECAGLLVFEDGSFEVGAGEALRPYERLYSGTEAAAALEEFMEEVKRVQETAESDDSSDEAE